MPEQRPSIDEALQEFLVDQRQRLAERTFRTYAVIVDLLRDCMNGYGHAWLDTEELARWEAASARNEDAYTEIFGPDKIVDNIGEFLGYFMIRKVMGGEELMRAAGTVTKKLARWLGERGYLDADEVADAVERGGDAGRDLPKADKLARLLFTQAAASTVELAGLAADDVVDDHLMIDRVGAGELWFEGGMGPVKVPAAAAKLAQPGWSVTVTLARTGGRWHLVSVGNVYP